MNPFDLDDDETGLSAEELRQQWEEAESDAFIEAYLQAMAEMPPAPAWADEDVNGLAGREGEELPPW